MKFLLDEMLPPAACGELAALGHDAAPVHDRALAGAEDSRVFERAVREDRVIVTENFADYALLLEQRLADAEPCVPVVFVRKSDLSRRGGLPRRLAERLDGWARSNPEPYVGAHWA
jgi:predicted nuclease of predicted toxin-antitoxin system